MRVDTSKYNTIIFQLKEVVGIHYFNGNRGNVMERDNNFDIELGIEKRPVLYSRIYESVKEVSYKINLNDTIFN